MSDLQHTSHTTAHSLLVRISQNELESTFDNVNPVNGRECLILTVTDMILSV